MANNIYPSSLFKAVTPSDTVPIIYSTTDGQTISPRSIYVGVAGDIVMKDREGVSATFIGVPAGSVLPIEPQYIMAATLATNIIALF